MKLTTYSGWLMLSTLFLTLLVSAATFAIGYHLTFFVYPLASIVSFFLLDFIGILCEERIKGLILTLIVVATSIIVSILFMDASYDGQAYHQPTIFALMQGWNPFYESHNQIIKDSWNMNIWIDHYCKGMETISASLALMVNNIEGGKAVNWILAFSMFFIIKGEFESVFKCLSGNKIVIYSLLIAFPIVFAHQALTFYIDLLGYYTFVFTVIAFYGIIIHKDKKCYYFLLFAAIVLAASAKVNMLFWCGYVSFISFLYLIKKRMWLDLKKTALYSFSAVLVGLCFVSFNPYITNTIDHKNPIYPMGINAEQTKYLTPGAQPYFMNDMNRLEQVLAAYSMRPNNELEMPYTPPTIITVKNFMSAGSASTRTGGCGLLFIEIVICSIITLLFVNKNGQLKFLVGIEVLLFVTLLILPMGSNQRYVPFFYLFPVIILLYVEYSGCKYKLFEYVKKGALVLLFANFAISSIVSAGYTLLNNIETRYYIKAIRQNDDTGYKSRNWSFNYKVLGNNIINKDAPDDMCPDGYERMKIQKSIPVYIDKRKLNNVAKNFVELKIIK